MRDYYYDVITDVQKLPCFYGSAMSSGARGSFSIKIKLGGATVETCKSLDHPG